MDSTIFKIIQNAGEIIMSYYNETLDVKEKEDKSPVTKADIEASRYLERCFKEKFPDYIIISEEKEDNTTNYGGNIRFFDPLD